MLFAAASLLAPATARAQPRVLTGIDVLEADGFAELKGKRIGLLTNPSGRDAAGRSTVSVLASAPGVRLVALFAPEHGFEGTAESMRISSGTYTLADGRAIPIYPSFGGVVAPTDEMLRDLDALVFDIQDVGVRFYTYATTMALAMESASRNHVAFFVLDRPNPITGSIVEGPVLDPGIRSFIAYFPETVRHGLTVGEIARLHKSVRRLDVDLHVVALRGWKRSMWFDQTGLPWTRPSPNMPDLDSAILYPGIGCLEGANISVGRGTPLPFRWIGAPWLDADRILQRLREAKLSGLAFERADLTPEKDVYKGKLCRGVRIIVTDRDRARPLDLFPHLACALRDTQGKKFDLQWNGPLKPGEENARFLLPTTRRRVGLDEFWKLYRSGANAERIVRIFHESAERFTVERRPYLLYQP